MHFLFSNRVTYVYNLKSTYVHQRCRMSYLDALYCHILLANLFVIVIISLLKDVVMYTFSVSLNFYGFTELMAKIAINTLYYIVINIEEVSYNS